MGENGNGLPKGGLLLKDDQRQVENEQNGKFTNGHNNSEKLKNAPEKPIIDEQSSDSLKGRKLFQYLATFTAGLVAMQGGMTMGWTSPILPFLDTPQSPVPRPTESEVSWITSLLAVGAIMGAVPSGKLADKIGRKWMIALTAVPFLGSWITLVLAKRIEMLYLGRLLGGIGAGAAYVLVPVYIGEIAEPAIRGVLCTLFPLLFSSGIVFSYIVGAYCSYLTFNLACCLVLLPFLTFIPFLPESPMWLIHKGRKVDASKALKTLRGANYNIDAEIYDLQEEADRLNSKRGGVRDLLGTKAGRRAIVACLGLMWFQQMSGIDAVLFYTVTIFQDAGSTIEPYFATIVIGIIEVIMALVVAVVIDKFGRKPLLILSGTAMTVCLAVLGYYFKLKEEGQDVSSYGWLPLICLSLFNFVFSVGYGSVPFTIVSEVFPPETKGVASSATIVLNWSLVFLVTKTFPSMVELMGQAMTFWTFGFQTALSAAFAYFFVPETKGKSLTEIQKKLERKRRSPQETQATLDPA